MIEKKVFLRGRYGGCTCNQQVQKETPRVDKRDFCYVRKSFISTVVVKKGTSEQPADTVSDYNNMVLSMGDNVWSLLIWS